MLVIVIIYSIQFGFHNYVNINATDQSWAAYCAAYVTATFMKIKNTMNISTVHYDMLSVWSSTYRCQFFLQQRTSFDQLSFTSQVIDLNSDVDPVLYFGARLGKNLLLHNGFLPFDVNISFVVAIYHCDS